MKNEVKIGLIVALVLLLAVFGIVWSNKKQEEQKIVNVVDRSLTAENRKVYEDKVVELQTKLDASNNDEEKYNLYLDLGRYKYSLGLLRESREYLNKALEINNDQYDLYQAMFMTLVDMQDYKNAEINIKRSIEIRKGNADLWKRYIAFKADQVKVDNAQINDLYAQAIGDIEKNGDVGNLVDIYTSYASWLEKSGDLLGSIEKWKKAIELNPGNKKVYEDEIKRIEALIKQLP